MKFQIYCAIIKKPQHEDFIRKIMRNKYIIRNRCKYKTANNTLAVFFVTHLLVLVGRTSSGSTGSGNNAMKVDRIVNYRRVKQRYRGGIQTPDQKYSIDAPQLLRGFFCQLEHVMIHSPNMILLGNSNARQFRGFPINQFFLTPELVGPRIIIGAHHGRERRTNEIWIVE